MEVKEAADLMDNLVGMVEDSHGADYDTALKMGIEALSANGDIIYRQAAIDAALDSLPDDEYWNEQVCKAINKLPPAHAEFINIAKVTMSMAKEADLVAVIRCRDCKWFGEPSPFIKDKYDCKIVDRLVNVDSFCGWAERREE